MKLLDEADVLYVESTSLSFCIKQLCEYVAKKMFICYKVCCYSVYIGTQ